MRTEAAGWVRDEIARLRAMGYGELVSREGQALHREMRTASGEVLIRETQVLWDDSKRRTLRVLVDVWHPHRQGFGIRTVASEDFIRAPDGSFIDE